METSPKAQEARFSIQNILQNGVYSGSLGSRITNAPSTSTLSHSHPDSLIKEKSPKPDYLTLSTDCHRSGAARELQDDRPKESVPTTSKFTRKEKEPKRSQPEKPYIPIWLLNNWAGPTAAALRTETASDPLSAREMPPLSLYHHRDSEDREKFKDSKGISNAKVGDGKVREQISCLAHIRNVPNLKVGDRTATQSRYFLESRDNEATSMSPTRHFGHRAESLQISLKNDNKIPTLPKPYDYSSLGPLPKVLEVFDINRPGDSASVHRDCRRVDTATQFEPKYQQRPKSTGCTTYEVYRQDTVCPSEVVPHVKHGSYLAPFTISDQGRTRTGSRALSTQTSFQHRAPSQKNHPTKNNSQDTCFGKSTSWPCSQVQLEDSSKNFMESNTMENSKRRSFIHEGTPLNLGTTPNTTIERRTGVLEEDELTSTENFTGKTSLEFDVPESLNRDLILCEHQEPSPQRYRVDESLTSNVSQTKEGVTVTLLNSALWEAFSTVGTEMIINRSGRRMFPYLALSVSGLSPEAMYRVSLQILPASSRRFKYITNRWLPVGIADTESLQDPYIHTDSLSSGDQLNKIKLIFSKVKLTNNKESADGNILLHSMHKYRIVTTFTEIGSTSRSSKQLAERRSAPLSFHFPETDFIAVTAYQNEAVTQMKIHNNPFAKAFRDANFASFRRGVTRRKRHSLATNSIKPAKRASLSQHPAGQTCPPGTSNTCPVRMSHAHQIIPSPDAETVSGFLPPEPAITLGDGLGGKQWTPSLLESGNETQGPPFTSPSFTLSPPYIFTQDKLQMPSSVSPWINLYSNIVRSHLLQFQYLHVNAASAAQPDSTSTTTVSTPETTATIAPHGGDAPESSIPTSSQRDGAADTPYLQMVPFHSLYPGTSETVRYYTGSRFTEPIPNVPDLRCWDSRQFLFNTPKCTDTDRGHM